MSNDHILNRRLYIPIAEDYSLHVLQREYHMSRTYKIVRHYFRSNRRRVIATGLTLEQAQTYCSDPESSSSTAKGSNARRTTRRNGPWFDGYYDE